MAPTPLMCENQWNTYLIDPQRAFVLYGHGRQYPPLSIDSFTRLVKLWVEHETPQPLVLYFISCHLKGDGAAEELEKYLVDHVGKQVRSLRLQSSFCHESRFFRPQKHLALVLKSASTMHFLQSLQLVDQEFGNDQRVEQVVSAGLLKAVKKVRRLEVKKCMFYGTVFDTALVSGIKPGQNGATAIESIAFLDNIICVDRAQGIYASQGTILRKVIQALVGGVAHNNDLKDFRASEPYSEDSSCDVEVRPYTPNELLKKCPNLHTLDLKNSKYVTIAALSNNQEARDELKGFFQNVANHEQLRKFRCRLNPHPLCNEDNEDYCKALRPLFKNKSQLEDLKLLHGNNTNVPQPVLEVVTKYLPKMKNLKTLGINLPPVPGSNFCAELKKNGTITSLMFMEEDNVNFVPVLGRPGWEGVSDLLNRNLRIRLASQFLQYRDSATKNEPNLDRSEEIDELDKNYVDLYPVHSGFYREKMAGLANKGFSGPNPLNNQLVLARCLERLGCEGGLRGGSGTYAFLCGAVSELLSHCKGPKKSVLVDQDQTDSNKRQRVE